MKNHFHAVSVRNLLIQLLSDKMNFIGLRRGCYIIRSLEITRESSLSWHSSFMCLKPMTMKRTFKTNISLQTFQFNKPPPKARPLPKTTRERNQTTLLYLISAAIATVGASYAAVPLYRVFCQFTSYGGTVKQVF